MIRSIFINTLYRGKARLDVQEIQTGSATVSVARTRVAESLI